MGTLRDWPSFADHGLVPPFFLKKFPDFKELRDGWELSLQWAHLNALRVKLETAATVQVGEIIDRRPEEPPHLSSAVSRPL